jgi:hypothetical protein
MRNAIPAAKRLAIFLDWAGSGSPHQHLVHTYAHMTLAKQQLCNIIYDVVFILCKEFQTGLSHVPSMLPF